VVVHQESALATPGSETRHDANRPLRIVHVTSGLGPGGAEGVLYRLVTHSRDIEHEVICLGPPDWYSDRLERVGVRVHHIAFYNLASAFSGAVPVHRLIRSSNADLVQCWMHRANAVGGIIGRLAGKPVVWNIRSGTLAPLRLASRVLAKASGRLARWVPNYVINCSARSADLHARWGYHAVPGSVIPNGYDSSVFFPDDEARSAMRSSVGVQRREFLLGTIGRWHAQKGYPDLLRAFRVVRQRNIPARLLMVGRGLDARNAELSQLIQESGCAEFVELLGEREDIASIARTPDVHVLASIGAEGFPNVVAETMLSGTGDSATIVGETGWVVQSGDANRLAGAIQEAYAEWVGAPSKWAARRDAARRRIAQHYSLDRMVQAYADVWRQVVQEID